MKKLLLIFFLTQKIRLKKPSRFTLLTVLCSVCLNVAAQNSCIAVGAEAPAFDPYHVAGKDKGTKTCPMCKYGMKTDGLIVWINDDLKNYEKMVSFLEAQYLTRSASKWKTFIIFMNPRREKEVMLKQKLGDFARKLNLKNVAFAFINSPTDAETAGVYEINPTVRNTIFAYKKRIITKKIVNFDTNNENFGSLVNF